ncbi:glutamate receptor U1-like isoform X1 [Prorops nasuta]|uniref:glutamate receptor U1-like isoform X1 n=2 Tax=Prorops nasuta TaxID=863751 RepID=UPI0034CFE98B
MRRKRIIKSLGIFFYFIFHFCNGQDVSVQEETSPESVNRWSPNTMPANIKISTLEDMPFSGTEEQNDTLVGKGYSFYLLNLLSKKLNFTYTIVPPEKQILGDDRTGILGQLYNKEIDMAVALLPVLPKMLNYCSFSITLDEIVLTVLMKRPEESATGSGLLAPFDRTVWLLVLISVVIMGPLIYVFVFLRGKFWKTAESEKYTMQSCVWFVYGALLKQGATISATSDSTRMLFATWWIFITILTSFYTANLTAFLTKPQFTLPIQSLNDVVSKNYEWAAFAGRTVQFLLTQDAETELTPLNKSKYHGKFIDEYRSPDEKILQIISSNKIFIGEAHYFQTLIFGDYKNKTAKQMEQSKRCTYVVMPKGFFIKNRAFAFPLNSSIEKLINEELLTMAESGIVQYVKRQDLPLADICPVDLRSSERRLRNADLSLTYKVVAGGFVASFVIFVTELILLLFRKGKNGTGDHEQNCVCCFGRKINNSVEDVPRNPAFLVNRSSNIPKNGSFPFYQDASIIPSSVGKKHYINGREYYVVTEKNGGQRLIPVRTPSAFLFQYTA